jgi:hypothetical protein
VAAVAELGAKQTELTTAALSAIAAQLFMGTLFMILTKIFA